MEAEGRSRHGCGSARREAAPIRRVSLGLRSELRPAGKDSEGARLGDTAAGVWARGAGGPGSLCPCGSLAQPCCLMISGGQVLCQRPLCIAGGNRNTHKDVTTGVLPRASERRPRRLLWGPRPGALSRGSPRETVAADGGGQQADPPRETAAKDGRDSGRIPP